MSILNGASHVAILGGTQVAAAAGSSVTINHGSQAGVSGAFKDLSAAAAHTAMHDSAARFDAPRCHQNTRGKYLDSLELWMLGKGDEFEGVRLIWLHGGAGAGKSAIMQSIVERCARHGIILGTFFFSRLDTSRNYAEVLVPTLAYQVVCAFPAAMAVLEPIIQRNPLIFKASLHTQAYELLVRPILYLIENGAVDTTSPLHRLFVIDGLDECNNPQKQVLIIRVIASILCDYHLPISFVVASRPELAITSSLEKEKKLLPIFTSISLDDDDDARSDIRQFVEDGFLDILDSHPWRHFIKLPWPNSRSVDRLVEKSSGHFIYASTAMRFIASSSENPARALDVVEGLQSSRTQSPFAELDALYMHILTSAQYSNQVLAILRHCYMSGFEHTVAEVCWIHQISQEEVLLFLSDVQSLVRLSPGFMAELTIFPKHASLHDFFVDKTRSQTLYMREEAYHVSFLERYFRLLDDALRVPASLLQLSQTHTMAVLMVHLETAILYSKNANLLQSLVSCHSPHDIWNFWRDMYALDTTPGGDTRNFIIHVTCMYIRAILHSVVDDALYFQQFQMYIELVLDDINDFVHRKPQYHIIPALIFSSGRSGLLLAFRLLSNWSRQFHIHESYQDHFLFLQLTDGDKIHPRCFEAIRSLPQSQLSWGSDLAIAMKLVLEQLVHLSWPGPSEILYTRASPHRKWLQQRRSLRQISLGSPRMRSTLSRRLATVHDASGRMYTSGLLSRAFLLCFWHRLRSGNRLRLEKIYTRRRRCHGLLKAIVFYLRKSDCTSEVARLARRSLPMVALWSPKLMTRARAEMDAYVRRWDESPDGLLERAQSLSINNMD